MTLKGIVDQIQHEMKVVQGEETKEMVYASQNTFSSETSAQEAFDRSIKKLFDVAGWSGLSMFTADFALYDPHGELKPGGPPQMDDYINIILPGPMPDNWVRVVHTATVENRVEFTVQPSPDPRKKQSEEVEHFFHQEARSTFRVELAGTTLIASEIGQHEGINNQEPQAGGRAVLNTMIAEGGWLFYQKLQWKVLTDYLVHL